MHTTISHPETTAENLTEEGTPVFANDGEYIGVVDVLLHQEGQGLAPTQETKPGRALRHNEALSSATMLQDLLLTIEAIPETPTFEEVPRFLLPGW
jgi:hypothetical protein